MAHSHAEGPTGRNPDKIVRVRLDMDTIPEILAAFGFFGAIFVCPLVWMLMKHQRAMAEIVHRSPDVEVYRRLEMLERELEELRSRQQDQIIRSDDNQQLSRRIASN